MFRHIRTCRGVPGLATRRIPDFANLLQIRLVHAKRQPAKGEDNSNERPRVYGLFTPAAAVLSVILSINAQTKPSISCEDEPTSPCDRGRCGQPGCEIHDCLFDDTLVNSLEIDTVVGHEVVAAIRKGHIQTCLQMARKLPSINAPITKSGSTSLMVACAVGNLKLVNVFLKNGADPTIADSNGVTCFARACCEGQCVIARRLYLDKRSDIQQSDYYGRRPVHQAVAGGSLDVLDFLFKVGVNPDSRTGAVTKEGSTRKSRVESPLHVAANQLSIPSKLVGKPLRHCMMEFLLSNGTDLSLQDANGDTVLHLCCRQGDFVGMVLCMSFSDQLDSVRQTCNQKGITFVDEADVRGIFFGTRVRLALLMPIQLRQHFLAWFYSESMTLFRA